MMRAMVLGLMAAGWTCEADVAGAVDAGRTSAGRAGAWRAIVAIHEEGVRTIEWREDVVGDHPKRGRFDFASYEGRADDIGSLYLDGEIRPLSRVVVPGEPPVEFRTPMRLTVTDGVLRAASAPHHDCVVIRPWDPSQLFFAGSPSVWNGLGRSLSATHMQTRAEHLEACTDLRVTEETTDRVTLEGEGPIWSSRYGHIVEIDVRTGDVARHRAITPIWRTVVMDWRMSGWHESGGARVPARVESVMCEPDLSAEELAKLRAERVAAGLPAESQWPEHPRYAEWEALRDRVLGVGPLRTRHATPPQEATITVVRVNDPASPPRFEWPEAGMYLSAFLEAPVPHPYPDGRLPSGGAEGGQGRAKPSGPGAEAKP